MISGIKTLCLTSQGSPYCLIYLKQNMRSNKHSALNYLTFEIIKGMFDMFMFIPDSTATKNGKLKLNLKIIKGLYNIVKCTHTSYSY